MKGKQFSDTLLHLRDSGLLKDAGLIPQHIQDLQNIGRLLKKSSEVTGYEPAHEASQRGNKGCGRWRANGGSWMPTSAVLGKIMTDADAAAKALKLLQAAQRVVPAMNANAYRPVASLLGGTSATL